MSFITGWLRGWRQDGVASEVGPILSGKGLGPCRRPCYLSIMETWPPWVTPAMILAAALWIVREVRVLGERMASLEGRILGWQDRSAGPPK